MLQNVPFYWGSIRKIVESFGAVFADIHIVRVDNDGDVYQTLEVPISYGPKEKWVIRNTQNPMPSDDDPIEMRLPRMSYELTGWQYDSLRRLGSTGRTVQALVNDNTVLKAQFNPVPYNFSFVLHVMAKSVEDGLMIVEQILPFFGPEYAINVKDMPELELEKDVLIVHEGAVAQEDSWDGTFQERRVITWTMNFTVKGYLYPPVKLNKVNLRTEINFHIDDGINSLGNDLLPSITTVPNPLDVSAVDVSAVDVEYSSDHRIARNIVVTSTPMSAVLFGGQSQIFSVIVVNDPDDSFTAEVETSSQTVNDTYSTDLVHGKFTYNCGSGARTAQEIISIKFLSGADPTKSVSVSLTLNP